MTQITAPVTSADAPAAVRAGCPAPVRVPIPAARLTDPQLSALIRCQHGVLTAAQAAAHGLPHETLRRRVQRGIWQRLLPGIYVLQCGPPSTLQWSIAALLYAGEASMLTGPAALAAHRLPVPRAPAASPLFAHTTAPNLTPPLPVATLTKPFPSAADFPSTLPLLPPPTVGFAYLPRLDVLVPHRMRRQNVAGIRIVRTTHLPLPFEAGPLRFAPLARAVVDTCLTVFESGNLDCADLLIAAALADGRVGLAELDEELSHAPRRNAAALRGHLTRLRTSARNAASHRLHDALITDEPSPPILDVAVYAGNRRVAQATALWPTRAVAAAVDAPEHEVESLSSLGFAVVQIAPQEVANDLVGVLRQVRTVLRERPEATLPSGVSLLPRATTAVTTRPAPSSHRSKSLRPRMQTQRVLTANSPARTGCSSLLPGGGTGQT